MNDMFKSRWFLLSAASVVGIILGLVLYANFTTNSYTASPENLGPGSSFTLSWKRFGDRYMPCGLEWSGNVLRVNNSSGENVFLNITEVEQALGIPDLYGRDMSQSDINSTRSLVSHYLETASGVMPSSLYQYLQNWEPKKFYLDVISGCLPGVDSSTIWRDFIAKFNKKNFSGIQGKYTVLPGTPAGDYTIDIEDVDYKPHQLKLHVGG
jgi:hypothetical protein